MTSSRSLGRTLAVVAGGIAILLATAAGLLICAAHNLNAIIASNHGVLLRYVGRVVGREITVDRIAARLGWGITVELENLKVADDPAFSELPFLLSQGVSCQLELLSLLSGRERITRLVFEQPQIWLRRSAQGVLNLSTLGAGVGSATAVADSKITALKLSALRVVSMSVENGQLYYEDAAQPGAGPLTLSQVALELEGFSARAPFDIDLRLAWSASAKQNVDLSGKVGPLLSNGRFDYSRVPLELKMTADSIEWATLAAALASASAPLPIPISIDGPFSIVSQIRGSIGDLSFDSSADLGGVKVGVPGQFEKPPGTAMEINAKGKWLEDALAVQAAKLKLAGMEVQASGVVYDPARQSSSAQVHSNQFDLAPLGAMLRATRSFAASGQAQFQGTVRVEHGAPNPDLTVTLDSVSAQVAPLSPPEIREVSGSVRVVGQRVSTQQLSFAAGSSRGTLRAELDSLSPLQMTYALSLDQLRPGEFLSRLDQTNVLQNVSAVGIVHGDPAAPIIEGNLRSGSGMVSGVGYSNGNSWRNFSMCDEVIQNHRQRHKFVVGLAVEHDEDVTGPALGRVGRRCINPNVPLRIQAFALNFGERDFPFGNTWQAFDPRLRRSCWEFHEGAAIELVIVQRVSEWIPFGRIVLVRPNLEAIRKASILRDQIGSEPKVRVGKPSEPFLLLGRWATL